MTIYDFKKHLRNMFEENREDGHLSAYLLELGYAVNRLLERGEISLFDDDEQVSKKLYDEMELPIKWN